MYLIASNLSIAIQFFKKDEDNSGLGVFITKLPIDNN
jgi:hypothetical protein